MNNQYELAVPAPVLEPSDAEKQAVALMSTVSIDGCEEKAAKLKAGATLMFDKPEPTPSAPTFLARANAAEQSRIQAKIDALL